MNQKDLCKSALTKHANSIPHWLGHWLGGCESLWHLLTSSQLIPSPYIQQPEGPKLNGLVRWAFNIRDGGLLKIIVFTDLKNTPEKTQHVAGHDRRIAGWMGWASRALITRKMTSFVSISWFLEHQMDKFCLAVLQLQTGMFGNKEVVKYSRLGQHLKVSRQII